MADREDQRPASPEAEIARLLEELGARIDSQADRISQQLAPVTKSVSEIERHVRELERELDGTVEPSMERAEPSERNRHEPESFDRPSNEPEPSTSDIIPLPQPTDAEPANTETSHPEPVEPEPVAPELIEPEPAATDEELYF